MPQAAPLGNGQSQQAAPAGLPNGPGNPVTIQQPATTGQVLSDQQLAAQYPDPNAIGDALARAMGEQLAQSNQQTQQLIQNQTEQTQQTVGALQQSIALMQQQTEAQLAQQNQPDYDRQYALSEQERTELGDVGMGAVQKLVDRALAVSTDEIVNRAQQSSLQEINTLKQQLAEAQQAINAQQVDTGANFRTQANVILAARQLQPETLQQDAHWQQFGAQVANPLTGETYAQAMDAAIQGQNLQTFTRVLDQYQQSVAAQQQQQQPLTPAGMPGLGTDARGFVPPVDNTGVQQQLQALQTQAHELRDRRMRTKISAEEFAAGIKDINSQVEALQAPNQQAQQGL